MLLWMVDDWRTQRVECVLMDVGGLEGMQNVCVNIL